MLDRHTGLASMDMDISMDIHVKFVDMDMEMDVKFHIHGKPDNYGTVRTDKLITVKTA